MCTGHQASCAARCFSAWIHNGRDTGSREGFAMAKILIADDEPRIRELIQEHLEHEGYQCTQASDGAAALAAVAAGGVDLVICLL